MSDLSELLAMVDHSLRVEGAQVHVADERRLRATVERLVEVSALGSGSRQGLARFLVRATALDLGIYPASIHDLYLARGRGEVPATFTVPAVNLRLPSFEMGRAVFRSLGKINAAAVIFEIARSEIGYTQQRPSEYATSVLAAAIAEGYRGPVFIQGDHFQVSAKKYAADAEVELQVLRDLVQEAILAGFFNIDIDASTLVDIRLPTVAAQQELNVQISASFAALIRALQPEGVQISIGGEIGEVGGHNSTAEELRAYLDGFNAVLARQCADQPGLSKISIQTGTSHGGTVLPDGSIAQVAVDFDTLRELSRIARTEYGLGGAVQHGASTLPEEAFGKFVEAEAVEVHLATNFMNMLYDHMPAGLRAQMYAWLDQNAAGERKPGMTDEQFYYKARKNALGAFKAQLYRLPEEDKRRLGDLWEAQFDRLFRLLGLRDTRPLIETFIRPVPVAPRLSDYLGGEAALEDVSDLAD